MSKYYGRTVGMTLAQYYGFLYKQNEIRSKKWTDEQILSKIKDEFKHYPIASKETLQEVAKKRLEYNSGHLIKGFFPLTPSFKYSKFGFIVNGLGHRMDEERIKKIRSKHAGRISVIKTTTKKACM